MKKTIALISAAIMTISAAALPVSAAEWVKTDSGYVYQLDNGKNAPKGWLTVGKNKYYINADGTRKTGWLKTKTARYYFGKDGVMYKSKWLKLKDGTKYYLGANGKAAMGVVTVDKVEYKFDEKTGKCLGENNHFILNTETNCVHSDPTCRAAKKIKKGNREEIDIGTDELAAYSKDGYWACGMKGCNDSETIKALPKPKK